MFSHFRNGCFILFFFLLSCEKESRSDQVPLVSVNIQLYVTDPSFFNLQYIGGWEYINGGSRGILVYRNSQDEFSAFDRHCPYNVSSSCGKVMVDSSNIQAIDTCCGSIFLLTDGSVLQGPAAYPLKKYQSSFDGSSLYITN